MDNKDQQLAAFLAMKMQTQGIPTFLPADDDPNVARHGVSFYADLGGNEDTAVMVRGARDAGTCYTIDVLPPHPSGRLIIGMREGGGFSFLNCPAPQVNVASRMSFRLEADGLVIEKVEPLPEPERIPAPVEVQMESLSFDGP